MASEQEARDYLAEVARNSPDIGTYVVARSGDIDELVQLTQQGIEEVVRKLIAERPKAAKQGEANMYALKVPLILIVPSAPVV